MDVNGELSRTARGLCVDLLGLAALLPLGLSLLDQALLACVFMVYVCALGRRADRRLVVDSVNETGNESRVAENLYDCEE